MQPPKAGPLAHKLRIPSWWLPSPIPQVSLGFEGACSDLDLPWPCGGAASRFMAYHKPLRNSQDYTEALRAARALAANITAHLRQVPGTDPAFEVFPYT